MSEDRFDPAAERWICGLGRLRDAVRQELVRRQLAELTETSARRLRVADVGCGQGTQLLHLARRGHEVVGLDPSARLLAELAETLRREPADVQARVTTMIGTGEQAPDLLAGEFDLVLCHGVLMYLDDPAPMLRALTRVAAPGATLSLLVRNAAALAMREGLRGRWPEALAAFGAVSYTNRLGLLAQAHHLAELDSTVASLGWSRDRWYGIRVFTDHLDQPAPDSAELDQIIAAEAAAAARDPYRQVAALLHVVYAHGAPT